MKKNTSQTRTLKQRIAAFAMAAVMAVGFVPHSLMASAAGTRELGNGTGFGTLSTTSDPVTLGRAEDTFMVDASGTMYRQGGSTLNAGKILVSKSVDNAATQTIDGRAFNLTQQDNFLVTVSQSSQSYGVSSRIPVPLDVVFVLDTSGSMGYNTDGSTSTHRSTAVVNAANSAIASLMEMNPYNRVAVVGFSDNASTLSGLAHYTGNAATNHITWSGSSIRGRTANGNVNTGASRNAEDGGTNIQAGITQGAQILTSVSDVTCDVEINGVTRTVTRMPILVVLSDGAATYSYSTNSWWNVDADSNTNRQGPGGTAYTGNGFLAALTAAYYKNEITENYYGANAASSESAAIYTIGVGLTINRDDEGDTLHQKQVAQLTLNPKDNYDDASIDNDYANQFRSYWRSYTAAAATTANTTFTVHVNDDWDGDAITYPFQNYERTERVWRNNRWTYVTYPDNVDETVTSIKYNDQYWAASSTDEINAAFTELVIEIQKRAITSPTYIDAAWGDDYSGYVTLTDYIGEYMEVKDIKGVLGNGYLYQGESFARMGSQYAATNGSTVPSAAVSEEQAAFNARLYQAITTRLLAGYAVNDDAAETQAHAAAQALLAAAAASSNQLYYNSANNFDNSIVWFGREYNKAVASAAEGLAAQAEVYEEDVSYQYVAPADDDSVEWLQSDAGQAAIKAATDDATTATPTHVIRSYFFHGSAGGAVESDGSYLDFVVRVARSLTAPYQQTVTISAPASLLAVQLVLIDDTDPSRPVAYSEPLVPARVVYEVGLRSDINAQNVSTIVSDEYKAEYGNVNSDGTYNFYTNDWVRIENVPSGAEHTRAMAKATFDVSDANSFYTYQQDTPLYTAQNTGSPLTAAQSEIAAAAARGDAEYYYQRSYYVWDTTSADGVAATLKTAWIKVDLGTDFAEYLVQKNGQWYVKAGTHTASTLLTNGDDIVKNPNATGTAERITHPMRTGSHDNSHYTVLLGNNGKLTYKSVEPTKSVGIYENTNAAAPTITDADGKTVMVGQVLEYTVSVPNGTGAAADITITDTVPAGTAYVDGSATNGGVHANGTVTWNLTNVAAGDTATVSFKVVVTEDALHGTTVDPITNTATAVIGNNTITTNTVTNQPEGKKASSASTSGQAAGNGLQVGDTITYTIQYFNDTEQTADVVIVDTIPAGTTYSGSASTPAAVYQDGKLTWTIEDVAPGAGGVVSFYVTVDASAVDSVTNGATIKIGDNNPQQTNTTSNKVKTGTLTLTKQVVGPDWMDKSAKTFTLTLTESTGKLAGEYAATGVDGGKVVFAGGVATVSIQHGETIVIQGLPVGTTIAVAETNVPEGYTAAVDNSTVVITEAGAVANVTNTYAITTNATVQLTGTKNLRVDGGVTLGDRMFSMTAVQYEYLPASQSYAPLAGGETLSAEATVLSGSNTATITFRNKIFTAPGTYYYVVSETDSKASNMTYDTTQYLVEIVVVDNGEGELTTNGAVVIKTRADANAAWEAPTSGAVVFNNSYKPAKVQANLAVNKVLTGRELKAGEFSFELRDKSGNLIDMATNAADGKVVFSAIEYSGATAANAPHEYTIKEIAAGAQGIAYDGKTVYVKVEVASVDGVLQTPTVTYSYNADYSNPVAAPQFDNTFTPQEIRLNLLANKTLDGRTLTDGEFVFRVRKDSVSGSVVATATNDAAGNIKFSTIGFNAAGTYKFYVGEVAGTDAATTYDKTRYEITVVVNYDQQEGVLSIGSVTLTAVGTDDQLTNGGAAAPNTVLSKAQDDTYLVVNGSNPTFTNYDVPSEIEVTLSGTKTTKDVNDVELTDKSFSFDLYAQDASGSVHLIGNGASSGNAVTFETITLEEAGTYRFWIRETNSGTVHGVTYDPAVYCAVVVVTRDATTNRLQAAAPVYYKVSAVGEMPGDQDAPVSAAFQNEYDAAGSLVVTARKNLTGRPLKGGEFGFVLERLTGENGSGTGLKHYGINDASGAVVFGTLNFTLGDDFAAGETTATHYYRMSEVEPAVDDATRLPGVTYTNQTYDLKVDLVQENGAITATVYTLSNGSWTPVAVNDAMQSAFVFTNSYAAVTGDSVSVSITKALTGRELKAGEFSFQAVDGNGSIAASATADANGQAVLTIHYPASTVPGTYTYTISEVDGGLGGVTYDPTQYTLVVEVTDPGTGTLNAEILANQSTVVNNSAAFANSYNTGEATVQFSGTKTLIGRVLNANEFGFSAVEYKKDDAGQWVATNRVFAGSNAADGAITFATISYNGVAAKGSYKYEVSEVAGALDNITYDTTTKYNVYVNVTDAGNGVLSAVVDMNPADAAAANALNFTNTYTPDDVSLTFASTKTLTGRDWLPGEAYDFAITDSTGVTVATATATANGQFVFTPIWFGLADVGNTYTYTVTEAKGSRPGIQYSTASYTFTVAVSKASTGELITTVNLGGASIVADPEDTLLIGSGFTNTYTAAPTSVTLSGTKVLTGKPLNAGEFDFAAEVIFNGQTIRSINDLTNSDAGVITIPAIELDAAGTYTVRVWEVAPNTDPYAGAGTMTYDSTVWTATVVVKDNTATGKLYVESISYADDNDQTTGETAIVFTNSFTPDKVIVIPDPTEVTAQLKVFKALAGGDLSAFAGKFRFRIEDETSGKKVAIGVNDADGNVFFYEADANGEITAQPFSFTFDAVGTYGYNISEENNSLPGVTSYDNTVHHVHIVVTQDAATGKLSAAVEGVTHGVVGGPLEITFTNSYKADPVQVIVSGAVFPALKKELDGRPLKAGEFSFYLMSGADIVSEGRNNANGVIEFPSITYTEKGQYSYTIVESDTGATGVTYDKHKVGVTVTVDDTDYDGKLEATLKYTGDTSFEVSSKADLSNGPQETFKNSYYGLPVDVKVYADKVLEGKALVGDDFTFVLTDAQGTPVTVKNDLSGRVTFDLGEFDTVGTYTYTLTEQRGADSHITYDTTQYTVVVEVTDDKQGYLHAAVTYNGKTDVPQFINIHTPDPIDVTINANKVLNGRIMLPGEFTFQLHDSTGALVDEAVNGLLGGVELEVKGIAAAGTYTYTVSEVKGNAAHVSYDTTKYLIDVEVVNNDGTLVATVKYPTEGITFTNTYKEPPVPAEPPVSPDTGDGTALALWMVLMLLSGIGIPVSFGQLRKKRHHSAH